MDKPLPLKIQEFQQAITEIIGNADIPIYILKYQIKDLLSEIEKLEQDFAQQELNEYYQSQKTEEDASEEGTPKD